VGVDVGASVDAAGDLMLDHRLRSLPVTDRARGKPLVVGILSRTDLLRSVATGAARPRGEPRPRARPARRP
jgi:CBS domain-containing protein